MSEDSESIIYLNVLLTNELFVGKRCQILSRRNMPIITNAQEWKMAVVRFDVNTLIPMLESSPTQTLGMKYGALAPFVRVTPLYYPAFFNEPSEVCSALNVALMAMYNILLPTLPVLCQFPPKFTLKDNKFYLYYPTAYITNNVSIFVSRDTFNDMTPSMPIASDLFPQNLETDPYYNANGQDIFYNLANGYSLGPPPRIGTPLAVSSSTADYAYIESIDPSLDSLNSINKIELYSSNLPIRAELDSSSNVQISSQSSAKISDFVIGNTSPYASRVLLEYLPGAQYRWIEMVGSGDIKDIDLSVFYVTRFGTSSELFLAPGTHMNIKLCFARKLGSLMAP